MPYQKRDPRVFPKQQIWVSHQQLEDAVKALEAWNDLKDWFITDDTRELFNSVEHFLLDIAWNIQATFKRASERNSREHTEKDTQS